jgi:hypothetical protein
MGFIFHFKLLLSLEHLYKLTHTGKYYLKKDKKAAFMNGGGGWTRTSDSTDMSRML